MQVRRPIGVELEGVGEGVKDLRGGVLVPALLQS
jgi:hypothetical protein